MTEASPIIQGAYFSDILDQPRALKETLKSLRALKIPESLFQRVRKGEFARIVLTGMGSSYHGLHPLNLDLIQAGLTPVMMETSELIHYGTRLLDPSTLVVAVSQSGRSAETVRLLELNQGRAAVIGITNTADSPLATQADFGLLTCAGEEFSVSCKTYTSCLMALQVLSDLLCGRALAETWADLEQAPALVEGFLNTWQDRVTAFMAELKGARHFFAVGRGASLAAVGTGPLTIKESTHKHAEGMSSAAFRHGPMEMLNPETWVFVYGGDAQTEALNARLHREVLEHGARGVMSGVETAFAGAKLPAASPRLRPLLEILPMQMITLALAALDGREAGRFERATKVTAVE